MNKLVIAIALLIVTSVTITSCQGPLVPQETHHYIHIVDESPDIYDIIPQFNP
jgi:hypothetical protein